MPSINSAACYSGASATVGQSIEFMHNKVYLVSSSHELSLRNATSVDTHYFSIDRTLVYQPFCADFGPSNISHLYRFISMMETKLKDPNLFDKRLILYTGIEQDKRANAAFLMSAYMMVAHKKSPEDAHRPLVGVTPTLMPFRDAGSGPATYFLTVLDCLKGLHKALVCGLFSFENFDLQAYERHERVEYGDFNWLTPKFVAFASPMDNPAGNPMRAMWTPTLMADYFVEHKVQTVVRLNNKLYDKSTFTERGIEHVELYFPDGSCPSEAVLKRFLDLCESREGPIAVHCKAGLGRTGSLIGAYMMKHYQFSSSEIIGFLRIMRPGSVVGPQQNWLHHKQLDLFRPDEHYSSAALSSVPARINFQQTQSETELQDSDYAGRADMYTAIPAQPRKTFDSNDLHTVIGGTAPPHSTAALIGAPAYHAASGILDHNTPRYNLQSLQGMPVRMRTAQPILADSKSVVGVAAKALANAISGAACMSANATLDGNVGRRTTSPR